MLTVARGRLRVLVVDDHRVFAEALAARLRPLPPVADVQVAFTAKQAQERTASHSPDLVLLDAHLGTESGTVLAGELLESRPDMAVLMVSGSDDPSAVVDALAAGARGWVPKDVSTEQMLSAIDEVVAGRRWLPPELTSEVLELLIAQRAEASTSPNPIVRELSARQREVLMLLAEGRNRAEIAEILGLSLNTVRTHIQAMLKKAGVRSTLALLAATRDDPELRRHIDD
jgi:DNA-binding NarL/FixJ family response regulator